VRLPFDDHFVFRARPFPCCGWRCPDVFAAAVYGASVSQLWAAGTFRLDVPVSRHRHRGCADISWHAHPPEAMAVCAYLALSSRHDVSCGSVASLTRMAWQRSDTASSTVRRAARAYRIHRCWSLVVARRSLEKLTPHQESSDRAGHDG